MADIPSFTYPVPSLNAGAGDTPDGTTFTFVCGLANLEARPPAFLILMADGAGHAWLDFWRPGCGNHCIRAVHGTERRHGEPFHGQTHENRDRCSSSRVKGHSALCAPLPAWARHGGGIRLACRCSIGQVPQQFARRNVGCRPWRMPVGALVSARRGCPD